MAGTLRSVYLDVIAELIEHSTELIEESIKITAEREHFNAAHSPRSSRPPVVLRGPEGVAPRAVSLKPIKTRPNICYASQLRIQQHPALSQHGSIRAGDASFISILLQRRGHRTPERHS